MKKCPKCGRAYSDMVSTCSVCHINLSSVNTARTTQTVPPVSQPYTPPKSYAPPQSGQSTYTPPSSPKPTYTQPNNSYHCPQNNYIPPQSQPGTPQQVDPVSDKVGILWIILSFLFPIAGLILFFCWRKKRPKSAKSVSIAGVVGISLGVVCTRVLNLDSEPEYIKLAEGDPVAYNRVFSTLGITHIDDRLYDQESACYVYVTSDGVVDSIQYGYNGQFIETMIDTLYFPCEDGSTAEKLYYDEIILSRYYGIEQLPFITYFSGIDPNYYSFRLQINDMDDLDNIRAAADIGVLVLDTSKEINKLKIENTESFLLSQGYIKK